MPAPLSLLPPRIPAAVVARRRARARRRSGGAAMFIVAVTLGLLAAMGVYGLSATAYDVRAAGHAREATQAQHAAEAGIMMTAEALQPGTAGEIVRTMQADLGSALRTSPSSKCRTAKPPSVVASDDSAKNRIAEACLVLSPSEMENLSPIKPWIHDRTADVFTNTSFGDRDAAQLVFPIIRVELTNPINWQGARENAGNQIGGQGVAPSIRTMVRATVFVDLKVGADQATAIKLSSQTIVAGRGHLVVGPYTP